MGYEDDDEGAWVDERRYAIARLLEARRHDSASAIVAVSEFGYSAGWNTDFETATLSVPAELFDAARDQFGNVITAACIDAVGASAAVCVDFRVLGTSCPADWVETIVRSLGRRFIPSERVPGAEVAVGS